MNSSVSDRAIEPLALLASRRMFAAGVGAADGRARPKDAPSPT